MSQSLNTVPNFDGSNYGYWKSRMRFFLKSIDVWSVIESRFQAPDKPTADGLLLKTNLVWRMTKL
jgi:hypothetical protein